MIFWRLNEIINERDVLGKEVAELVGVHPNTISRLRNSSELPHIDGELLDKLCTALNCHLFDLIQFVPEGQSSKLADRLEAFVLATGESKGEVIFKALQAYLDTTANSSSLTATPSNTEAEDSIIHLSNQTSSIVLVEKDQQVDLKQHILAFIEEIKKECQHQCDVAVESFDSFMNEVQRDLNQEFFVKIARPGILDALLKDKAKELRSKFSEYLDEKIQNVWQFRLAKQLESSFEGLRTRVDKETGKPYVDLFLDLNYKLGLENPSRLKEWVSQPGRTMMLDVALILAESRISGEQSEWFSTVASRSIDTAVIGAAYVLLGPLGLVAGTGIKVWRANAQFDEMKEQIKQSLPKVAEEKAIFIRKSVTLCFDAYVKQVENLMSEDLLTIQKSSSAVE